MVTDAMDFILMLTRADRTVEDCLDVLDEAAAAGLRHIGFKDVGAPPAMLRELNRRIRALGATSYMEVVSTSPEAALRSAAVAAEMQVDRLLGGTDAEAILRVIDGAGIEYFPFPGRPEGHPTRLGGTPVDVHAHCAAFAARGCRGVDLLAYRATEADPVELVRAARRALGRAGLLIVAGSVNSPARVRALDAAGADAFTIGTAVFDGSFSPRKGTLRARLRDVLDVCRAPSNAVA
jgi:hypothetical protein